MIVLPNGALTTKNEADKPMVSGFKGVGLNMAYIITTSIEGNLAQLQATQQKIQGRNSVAITKQRVEEVQQVVTQCTDKVGVIKTELGGLCAKISSPIE